MHDGLYIGLMSGTSIDAIDAVAVELTDSDCNFIGHRQHNWPSELQQRVRTLTQPGDNEIDQLGVVDILVAEQFALATKKLLQQLAIAPEKIVAIGSHGQTIRHRPEPSPGFTIQIGDPNHIAELTGITTVGDFRRRDMAVGGQGAPLAPAFHVAQFASSTEERVAINLGGIANITVMPADRDDQSIGFDTGPANTLMDSWARQHLNAAYDDDGDWGRGGTTDSALLAHLLSDPYFAQPAPKSTGTEYFNAQWLSNKLAGFEQVAPKDVQATLCALTVETIADQIERHSPQCKRIILCGGGTYNRYLVESFKKRFLNATIQSSAEFGIAPEHIEAMAFAWLARRRLCGLAGNLPSVTGASKPVALGSIYSGNI